MGNPSQAIASTASPNNYLMVKPEYALSYNKEKGTPNWVEWELNSRDIGQEPRSNNFHPEKALPVEWRVEPILYRESGFDRGHLCPSGDRTEIPKRTTKLSQWRIWFPKLQTTIVDYEKIREV